MMRKVCTRTPSCRASAFTPLSGETLKPITSALPWSARSMSFTAMAPVPLWMTLHETFVLSIWLIESTMASTEPCTSARTMRLRTSLSCSCICLKISSALRACVTPPRSSSLRRCDSSSASSRARFSFFITRNSAPASGTPERPMMETAPEGPADLRRRPELSVSARTRP